MNLQNHYTPLKWIKKPKKSVFFANASAQGISFKWSIYDYSQKKGQAPSRLFKIYAAFRDKKYEKHFSQKAQAEYFCDRETVKLQQEGFGLKNVQTNLTEAQVKEAESAYLKIRDMKLSLTAIIDEWIETQATLKKISVENAVNEYLASNKEDLNLRYHTIRERRIILARLVKQNGHKLIHKLTAEDCRQQINLIVTKPPAHQTKMNRRGVISAFLGWCKVRKHIFNNISEEIPRAKKESREPVILTVGDSRKLLHAAEEHKGGILAPYVALALFGGFRDAEIKRLKWSDIDLANKSILVKSGDAKTRKSRSHKLEDNLCEILTWYTDLEIAPKNFTKLWQEVREKAGFTASVWSEDTTRHSAISYWLRINKDMGKAAYRFGNSAAIIGQHYEHLVPVEQTALDFYKISAKGVEDTKEPKPTIHDEVYPSCHPEIEASI
jgi:integrase